MPHDANTVVFSLFLIFASAAIMSTLVLYTKQSLLVAYILVGTILGPFGLKFITNAHFIKETGEIGIIFLLFLLGLELRPQILWKLFKETTVTTLFSAVIFGVIGYAVGRCFHFQIIESLIIAASMMFSSTIIGLKLLPTGVTEQRRIAELMIGILLFQDLIAIFVLLFLNTIHANHIAWMDILKTIIALPMIFILGYSLQRFVLMRLLRRFGHIHEYLFLLSVGWCLAITEFSKFVGLSESIGAFIAGVSIATNPIALYIENNLQSVRDFFLIIFFFYIGINFNFEYLPMIWLPAMALSAAILFLKPIIFRFLLSKISESKYVAWEVGARLGQASEFSLLIAYLASQIKIITPEVSYLIQATAIITFLSSSYFVVLRYPTPVNLLKGDYHGD